MRTHPARHSALLTFQVMEDESSGPQHDVVSRRLTTPGVSSAAERRRRLSRRSDPGLSVVYDELSALDSGWDVTTAATTSCGVTRSSSLRNSFLRARVREPLWIQSKYVSSLHGFVGAVFPNPNGNCTRNNCSSVVR